MIGINEAMICIFQVRLKSYDCLLSYVLYLLHQIICIFSSSFQILDDSCKQLFRRFVVVLELFTRSFEFLWIFIQREVGQMHI